MSIHGEVIGFDGVGTFNQSGGVNSDSGLGIILGQSAGSSGTYNQSGGTCFGEVVLGSSAGATGTYNLSNSASLDAPEVRVGSGGNGTFNQTGGTLNAEFFSVGATGTINISGGAALVSILGANSAGQLNIVGGTVTVTDFMAVSAGGTATLSGGTLNATTLDLTASSWQQLHFNGGTLNLSGGTSSGSGNLSIGSTGAIAVLNQSGGTTLVNIGGDLALAAGAGSAVTCSVGGGTLSVGGNEFIGFAGNGLFNQFAGTHTVSGTLFLGFGAGSSGTCNLLGGSLSAGSVVVNTGGRFNLLGGSLTTNSLTINAGGTLAGFGAVSTGQPLLTMAGTLMAQNGNLVINMVGLNSSGQLSNAVGSNLFIDAIAIADDGGITVNAQGSVVFNVPIRNAAGQAITLMGGTLGAPQIVNNGVVLGSGQISAELVNNATASFNGPTQIVGNVTNTTAASITVRNSQLLITGLTINNGIIRATSGGSVDFSGGLTGNPLLSASASAVPAPATTSYSGAVILEPNSALLAPFIRQDSLTLRGTPGQPATFASTSIRSRALGGADSTLRLLSIQTDGAGNPLGRLDLADTSLTVDAAATPPASVKAYLAAAYTANGDWSGPGGLTSSLAVGNPAKFSVAYASGSDQSAQDAGIPVAAGQVLVRPTLTGDANMDGTVDFFDISQILGYKYNTGQPASYTDGDLNYDGVVDFLDITVILSANYDTGATFGPAQATEVASMAAELATSSVPEPTGLALMGLGLTGFLARRRAPRRSTMPPRRRCGVGDGFAAPSFSCYSPSFRSPATAGVGRSSARPGFSTGSAE
jgi:hypothetical protein